MVKKTVILFFLLGIIGLSGCHTAQRTTVRAGYDSYPYGVRYVDPYFYPAYYYDPYPRFFFGTDFLFVQPHNHFIVRDPGFRAPRRSLRGRGGVAPRSSFGSAAPNAAPNTGGGGGGGSRSLRGR